MIRTRLFLFFKVNNVDEILSCHCDFLDACLKDCMLTIPVLLSTITKILSICVNFCKFMQVSFYCFLFCFLNVVEKLTITHFVNIFANELYIKLYKLAADAALFCGSGTGFFTKFNLRVLLSGIFLRTLSLI